MKESELKAIVGEIESLESQKASLNEEVKSILAEAKNAGFDPKIIRLILSIRKKNPKEYEQEQDLLMQYQEILNN